MTGPVTPGQEGPSFGPPPLPEGWIAQWDGMNKKYYYVQISTGQSTWEVPTQAVSMGGTPTPTVDSVFQQPGTSPYPQVAGEVGPDGQRGLGQMAMNQLLHSQGGSGKQNPLLSMAGQFLGGKTNTSHNSSSGLVGQLGGLASQMFAGQKVNEQQHQQQQTYSGQVPQGAYNQNQGGMMGALGGKLGTMFGGHSTQNTNFGYSQGNTQQGGYTGQAPPTSYQTPNAPAYNPDAPVPIPAHQSSYSSPLPQHQNPNQQQPSYGVQPPIPQSYSNPQGPQTSNFSPPPQNQQPHYGGAQNQYSSPPQNQQNQQVPYGGGQQPPYGGGQSPYGGQTPSFPPPPSGLQQGQYGQGPPPSGPYGQGPPQQAPYGGGQPPYGGGPQNSGNLSQPLHGFHASHEGGLYGNSGAPPKPMGSHPNYGGGQGGW